MTVKLVIIKIIIIIIINKNKLENQQVSKDCVCVGINCSWKSFHKYWKQA